MFGNAKPPSTLTYFIQPGHIFLSRSPAVVSSVLGSCVAVCIHDRSRRFGGMNHFLYPSVSSPEKSTAVFGNVATRTLINMFLQEGSQRKHLEAQIFGGAKNDALKEKDIGRENIRVARRILAKARIPLVSEDVGGQKGRKVVFSTAENEVLVIRVENLRQQDWYPYEGGR